MSTTNKKPKITDIKLSKQQQDKLDLIKKSNMSDYRRSLHQRHIIGECCKCGKVPTKKVIYDVDGAQLIEKYCDKHAP
jgi:hypothetical protein